VVVDHFELTTAECELFGGLLSNKFAWWNKREDDVLDTRGMALVLLQGWNGCLYFLT